MGRSPCESRSHPNFTTGNSEGILRRSCSNCSRDFADRFSDQLDFCDPSQWHRQTGKKATYEAVISDAVLCQIWNKCGRIDPADTKLTLYATATFDHEILNQGVHSWIRRRWTHFNVAAHSVVALLLSHVVAFLLCHGVAGAYQISQSLPWWITTLVLVAIFSCTGLGAWRQTMKMIEFQIERQVLAQESQ